MRILIAAALLGATAIGGVAVAAQTTRPMKADANGDGRVTRAEYVAAAQARFAAADTNRDGALTPDEQRAAHGGKRAGRPGAVGPQDGPPPPPGAGMPGRGGPGAMLQRLDTDGDGRISRAEFAKASADRFARMDANGNGAIEAAEMAGGRGGGRGMMRSDADGNGTLTRAEFDRQSADRFARMDTNGDGYIDASEQAAMGRMMRGGRDGARPAPPPPATPPAN